MNEIIVKVDKKGRIVIPSDIRRRFKIKNLVKIIVKEDRIALKPVEDPLKALEKLVVKGTADVEAEIQRLHMVTERELQKEALNCPY